MSADTFAVTKIVGTSPTSIEDAIDGALTTARKTLRNLDWFEVVSTRGYINDGKVAYYQVTLEIGFKYEAAS
ncbi:dodecin [Henriciella mobilis]|uniref:Dodecin domain-containing protein n=1 Tax=Henriciella mobilis TaxID=2305467 RepID=A0A399RLQ2_9PROT|nr:dodecin [Henriciella mobilis]RIJ16019.1 dodecin domain-containing protein [Henriciella mobilis]RIJ23069.1 dodecin domain-containing protein [Henriciella mobilis]RIJ32606.1 dodecin domain-containing protein [Henriciella mobilis]